MKKWKIYYVKASNEYAICELCPFHTPREELMKQNFKNYIDKYKKTGTIDTDIHEIVITETDIKKPRNILWYLGTVKDSKGILRIVRARTTYEYYRKAKKEAWPSGEIHEPCVITADKKDSFFSHSSDIEEKIEARGIRYILAKIERKVFTIGN